MKFFSSCLKYPRSWGIAYITVPHAIFHLQTFCIQQPSLSQTTLQKRSINQHVYTYHPDLPPGAKLLDTAARCKRAFATRHASCRLTRPYPAEPRRSGPDTRRGHLSKPSCWLSNEKATTWQWRDGHLRKAAGLGGRRQYAERQWHPSQRRGAICGPPGHRVLHAVPGVCQARS